MGAAGGEAVAWASARYRCASRVCKWLPLAAVLWDACVRATLARGEPELGADSGVARPPYVEQLRIAQDLARVAGGWVTIQDYGLSGEGRPLRAIRLMDPAQRSGANRAAVLITGATHGSEYLGVEDRLAPWLWEHRQSSPGLARFLATGGVVLLVPIVNPDGYTYGIRENARGIDLNRDFELPVLKEARFKAPESAALAHWLDRELIQDGLELKLAVDYHCCEHALLFPWSYTDVAISPAELKRHEAVAHLLQREFGPTYGYGSTGQKLGYLARGTSKDYYYARYGALAFTFEGAFREEPRHFAAHVAWWDQLLGGLATKAGAVAPLAEPLAAH